MHSFTFSDSVLGDALDTLVLARIAVDSAIGDVRALLDIECDIDRAARTIQIATSTLAGRMLCRVYLGYLARELPAGTYKVARVMKRTLARADAAGGGVSAA